VPSLVAFPGCIGKALDSPFLCHAIGHRAGCWPRRRRGERGPICSARRSCVRRHHVARAGGFATVVEAATSRRPATSIAPRAQAVRRHHVRGWHRRIALSISDPARDGHITRSARRNEQTKKEMKAIWRIHSGQFAKEWMTSHRGGVASASPPSGSRSGPPEREVGCELRALMPFISAAKTRSPDVAGGSGGCAST